MLIVLLHDEQLLIGIATGIAIPINDFFSASLCLKNPEYWHKTNWEKSSPPEKSSPSCEYVVCTDSSMLLFTNKFFVLIMFLPILYWAFFDYLGSYKRICIQFLLLNVIAWSNIPWQDVNEISQTRGYLKIAFAIFKIFLPPICPSVETKESKSFPRFWPYTDLPNANVIC